MIEIGDYLTDFQTQLDTLGAGGWELLHIYNTQAMFISGGSGINVTGSVILPAGVVSSSSQVKVNLPNGTVSSSTQAVTWTVATASYYALPFDIGAYATTGSNIFKGDQIITGTLFISGGSEFGGNLVPIIPRGATIGTLERPFRDIFLQSASINIASDISGGRNATISNADGNVTIQAAGLQLKSASFVSFEISEDARTKIRVPQIPAGDIGAFSIIGNISGSYQPVTSTGGMVHITGNDGQANRFNMDAFGSGSTTSFNGVIGRAGRGTVTSPSQSKAGDVVLRLTATGWRGDTGFGGVSIVGGSTTTLDFVNLEDQMDNARGSAQQFYNAPIGTRNRVLCAQIDAGGLFVSGTFTSSLAQGYLWVGGAGNVSRLLSTSSFATTGSNTLIGNQIISGSLTLSSGSALNINNGFYVGGNKQFNYGEFSDTTTQSGSANTAHSMTFNTTVIADGFSVISGSRITATYTGIYNLQFSAQLDNTSNTNEVIDIWIAVTGSNVPNSNTTVSINKAQAGNFGKTVAAWNYMIPLSASNYVELKWSSTGAGIILLATGSASGPTRPATPSAIATITQIA
jgi:hypothetical protein